MEATAAGRSWCKRRGGLGLFAQADYMVAMKSVGQDNDANKHDSEQDAQWPPIPWHGGDGGIQRFAFRLPFCFLNVLGQHAVFVESQETRRGTNEAAIESAAGQLVPLTAFEGFKETSADARGSGNFIERNAAHFALAFQMFAEGCRRHSAKNPETTKNIGAGGESVNRSRLERQ